MLGGGSSILQVLNSDQHVEAWGKPVPEQQQLLSGQWATGLQCLHLAPSSKQAMETRRLHRGHGFTFPTTGWETRGWNSAWDVLDYHLINENFIAHAASAFGIPERSPYLGSIILITYIHKVKPIAKMGEAVNNKRNVSLESKTPDQVLKCIIRTLTVVSLCTVIPSNHPRPNLYERGYIVDKSKLKIFTFFIYFVIFLLWF